MKIIVDADATPKKALAICRKAAKEFGVSLVTVANFNHRIESGHHVVTGDAPQEADLQVINLAARGISWLPRTGDWQRWSWVKEQRPCPHRRFTRRKPLIFSWRRET